MEIRYDYNNNEVIIEVPVELLFTDLDVFSSKKVHHIENITDEWIQQHLKHCDISIIRLTPHIKLFRFFMGYPNVLPNEYLAWHDYLYKSRGMEPQLSHNDLLYKRYQEYKKMKRSFMDNPDFFYEHPPIVTYNPKGYFNIRDGHHRAIFLYCHGRRRIHVQMKIEDYSKWINLEMEIETFETIKNQKRDLIYTPILHPAYYVKDSERDSVSPTRLDLILEYLGPRNLRDVKIIDIGCNIGYYARHFVREGGIVTGVEPYKDHYELLESLNRLEQVEFELLTTRFELTDLPRFDIGLLLTVFYHNMKDTEVCSRFLNNINNSIDKLLFWESGDEVEIEKELILQHTHFTRYEKLGVTFGTGKTRELGVFIR